MVEAEKPVVKDKAKAEKRRQKEKLEQRKADSLKKQEMAELGSKKGAVSAWESDKENFFEEFAGAPVPNPAGTTPAKYPIKILDIDTVALTQPKLAKLLEDSLALIQVRPSTPEHRNDEGRFPGYAPGRMAYWEFSYLGGGGRLVVDAIAGIIYISAHYSYNYKLVKTAATPVGPVRVAKQQRKIVRDWEKRIREEELRKSREEASPAEDGGPPTAFPVPSGLSLSPLPAISSASLASPSIVRSPSVVRHEPFASPDDPVFIPPSQRYISPHGAVGDRRPPGIGAPGYRLF
jgi:hypothetical protein